MAMTGEAAGDRVVVELAGKDALPFLQGLVSNDVGPLERGPGLVWAALLTPQGKYLADFLIGRLADGRLILDIKDSIAAATLRRLAMYRLRAEVRMEESALKVTRGTGEAPEGALPDPRHPALGWRHYGEAAGAAPATDWDALRVAHVIPETGIELTDETYILEAGFERLHGVDFRKGCYVGQEVTARMKHKTELRKGLVRVRVEGAAPVGTPLLTADGKEAGTLYTQSGGAGIAHLRLDRAQGALFAGSAVITADLQDRVPDQA
jgi:folate-binding protein YgfZ